MKDNDPPEGFEYWGNGHPEFPVEDWKTEVNNGDTRLGYWEWVKHQTGECESLAKPGEKT